MPSRKSCKILEGRENGRKSLEGLHATAPKGNIRVIMAITRREVVPTAKVGVEIGGTEAKHAHFQERQLGWLDFEGGAILQFS